jgi:3-phenylpropionate/trans-cinnamate dioxygenase ferredoxin reductase subunit
MTADAACRGIRERDSEGSIGLIGAEPVPPYSRPPLSKGLWQGKDEASIWRGTGELGVELHLGRRVLAIDRAERSVSVDDGEHIGFERLLLATGGRPRRLAGSGADQVIAYRTFADYQRLREQAGPGVRALVVGGGFIGSELAAALASAGCRVTILFPEPAIGTRLFPADLAAAVDAVYREHGVEVRPGALVEGVEAGPELVLAGGERLAGEVVVAGLGIDPASELATAAGLRVDDGIVVDAYGVADDRGEIFAAGDVARFPAPVLGTLIRVEHEDNANSHGFAVGANMAGASEPYEHLPFFYSDLFELGYEAVGEVDSRHETVAEWAEPYRTGVVAYLDAERRPRGFLLWNVWGRVADATGLIAAGEPLAAGTLAALMA